MKLSTKAIVSVAALTAAIGGLSLTAVASDLRPADLVKMANDGTIKPFDHLDKVATDLHPGSTITDADIDLEAGRVVYELDLRDAKGVKWEVELDAKTGDVISNRKD